MGGEGTNAGAGQSGAAPDKKKEAAEAKAKKEAEVAEAKAKKEAEAAEAKAKKKAEVAEAKAKKEADKAKEWADKLAANKADTIKWDAAYQTSFRFFEENQDLTEAFFGVDGTAFLTEELAIASNQEYKRIIVKPKKKVEATEDTIKEEEEERWAAARHLASLVFDQYPDSKEVYVTVQGVAFWTEELAASNHQEFKKFVKEG